MNLSQFALRTVVIAKRMNQNIEETMRRVALAVDQTIVMATPVDTGRARSNWVVGLTEPDRRTVEDFPAGRQGATGGAAAAQAIARGREVIERYRSSARSIWVSNNLPYIVRLNEGWSAQAPAGFVQQAFAAGVRVAKNARILRGV